MTILEALEEVNDSLITATRPQFIYVAAEWEANQIVDALTNAQFPILVVLPIIVTDVPGPSGVLKSTFDFSAFMLNKPTLATENFVTADIDTDSTAPMRALARQFMHKLQHHSIIDPETNGIQTITYTPEFGLWDAHLFGVFIRATVPVMERISGCV